MDSVPLSLSHTNSRQREATEVVIIRGHGGSCKNKYRVVLWSESESEIPPLEEKKAELQGHKKTR